MKEYILIFWLTSSALISQAQIQKPIIWSYAAKKTSANDAVVFLKATINSGWHIYSTYQTGEGPVKTTVKFKSSKDYSLIGNIIEPKPIKKYEEAFEMDIYYHEQSVIFKQKLKLNKPETVVKGSLEYMVCDDHQCLPAETVSFTIPIFLAKK